MISVRRLEARHGSFHMASISLEVPAGELLVLLGPSGAGKTLLLESILGLKPLESGQIEIGGRDVTELPPEERHVAYMPQDVALFPHLSVRDNILFGRRVRNTMAGADAQLSDLAAMLRIDHLLERVQVRSLSGGEQQRVALARALITNPRVLFLDESFSALDAHIRRELLLQLRDLQQELAFTAVYITHSQHEALVVADRVAVLMDGATVQVGTPGHVFRRPADLRVARFLQLANIMEVERVSGRSCSVAGIELELSEEHPDAKGMWLGIGASDVLVVRPQEAERLNLRVNCLAAKVAGVGGRHERSRIDVALDDAPQLVISCELDARVRLIDNEALAAGDAVRVYLAPRALALFPGEARGRLPG